MISNITPAIIPYIKLATDFVKITKVNDTKAPKKVIESLYQNSFWKSKYFWNLIIYGFMNPLKKGTAAISNNRYVEFWVLKKIYTRGAKRINIMAINIPRIIETIQAESIYSSNSPPFWIRTTFTPVSVKTSSRAIARRAMP